MVKLAIQDLCTGCSACVACCPHDAISMRADNEGFMRPSVDQGRCVGCGHCEKTCPVISESESTRSKSPRCYAAKSNDPDIVRLSSSGGMFSEFSLKVLSRGGVVYGAAYVGDDLDVKHIRVDTEEGLSALRGSKYVYSETNTIYRSVKEDLKSREVLFSGTPCQIAGLKAFLGNDHKNLLTIEVICHGTPPKRLFDALKCEMMEKHGKLTAISFRDKDNGWGSRAITGWYASGAKIRESGSLNDYFKAFIAHLTLRHSCERCKFNNGRSGADVTLGDFWGVDRILPEMADNAGMSAVMLHSDKGLREFNAIDCFKSEVRLSDIVACNPSYNAKRKAEQYRNLFMASVYSIGISAAYCKYFKPRRVSFFMRVIRALYSALCGTLQNLCGKIEQPQYH